MTTGLLQMVEMTGVEPVSESTSSETSPGADDDLHSLARAHTVMLQGLVASLCVTRAKLSVFTFTTHRRLSLTVVLQGETLTAYAARATG